MKIKQLFALVGGLLFSIGAWAQTDVTSTYITNADFSATEGWTAYVSGSYRDYGNGLIGTYGVRTADGQSVSTNDATHLGTEYCFGFECRWSGNYASYNQTTSELPIGVYTLTYDVEDTNPNTSNASYNNLFYVQVGDTKYADSKTEWMGKGKSSWTTHTITFNITTASTAIISLGYGTGSNNLGSKNTPTLHVSHLTLTWTDPLKAGKDALQAEIDKAKLCDAKEGLADAIAAAEDVLASATTESELEEALATLQAADKDAVLRYENGLADATALAPVVTDFVVNGTFTDNVNGWTCTGGFQNQARASNQNGAFTVPFFENWTPSDKVKVNKMYQTISNIPNGTYRLDIAAFVNTLADPNESQYVFANNDKVYLTTGDPTAYEVYTVVTTNQIEIGLEQTTATANWMGIDNVSLRYYGAGDVVNDAKNASHKLAWQEAKAAAEAAYADDTYENVTGSEKSDLETEIAKAEPSTADDYDAAADALTTATATFIAAKAAYDGLAALWNAGVPELVYALTDKYTAIGDAYFGEGAVEDAADAEARTAAMKTAIRAYYESHAMAEKVEGAVDCAEAIAGADPNTNTGWTGGIGTDNRSWEQYTDASGNPGGRYYDGGWSTTAAVNINMSRSISLPAGTYLLTVTARASENLTSYTMSVADSEVDLPTNGSDDNQGVFGHGWDDVSVEFVSDGHPVTLTIAATSTDYQQWISFNRFRLVRLSLNTSAYASSTEYDALNSAISAAEAKTLGFEDGQYAPYNNIEALEALDAAKAIDQDAELTNLKTDVEATTTALTGATWTANDGEVNAIYDGDFDNQDQHTSSPTTLDGWTAVDGLRQLIKNAENDPGLTYASANAAIFTWGGTTITYGEQEGYTMPLGANVYKLTFKVTGWRDGDLPSWISAALYKNESEVVSAIKTPTITGRINQAEGDPFITLTCYLTVPEAGNYVLKLFTNKHTAWTDFNMVKAVAENETLDEEVDYTPSETYANITLERTIKNSDTWNTLVLPFDVTNEELKAAFGDDVKVAQFSANDGERPNVITFQTMDDDEDAITANVPVLLKTSSTYSPYTFTGRLTKTGEAKVAGTNFDFVGNYEASITLEEKDYYISGNALYKSKGTATLKGTRAYILNKNKGNDSEVKFFIDDEDMTTRIDGIGNDAQNTDAIYNLAGQRLTKATKGVNIINGKKVVIK